MVRFGGYVSAGFIMRPEVSILALKSESVLLVCCVGQQHSMVGKTCLFLLFFGLEWTHTTLKLVILMFTKPLAQLLFFNIMDKFDCTTHNFCVSIGVEIVLFLYLYHNFVLQHYESKAKVRRHHVRNLIHQQLPHQRNWIAKEDLLSLVK